MVRVLVLLSVILFSVYVTEQAYFLQEDFINKINEKASTWKAGVNFDPNTPEDRLMKLLGSNGVQFPNKFNLHMYKSHDHAYDRLSDGIPEEFDAREKWSHCQSIREVRDQGYCGSCWAVSTSSAFADRLCIATNYKFNKILSTQELAFCCTMCGSGCNGGSPIRAWEYFKTHGIVTGGGYNTTDGCAPYKVPPSSTYYEILLEESKICPTECYGDTTIEFSSDHKYTRDFYFLNYEDVQKDIMTHGPVGVSFSVYEDFFNYKSGVYVKSENTTLKSGHAVKMIGWGVEEGIPYWLCANSWGEKWGINGFFKIRRGTNECGIDYSATAGVPKI